MKISEITGFKNKLINALLIPFVIFICSCGMYILLSIFSK